MTATFTTPAIMSAPMVRALLDGRKSQTRRLVTSQWANLKMHFDQGERCFVWVREAWIHGFEFDDHDMPIYDGEEMREKTWYRSDTPELRWADHENTPWKPSIHMPRWASRLTLEVTDVRLQRLQDIDAVDCRAEGVLLDEALYTDKAAFGTYKDLWTILHGKNSWESNPEVIAISFRVYLQNIDAFLAERGVA